MAPSGAPAVAVTARDGQPGGTRKVRGKFFSMYVPANFQDKSVPQASGEQMVIVNAPSSNQATPVRVGVVTDPAPKKTATELSYDLEVFKKSEGAKDLTRSALKWPGAQNAILLQWTQTLAGANPQRTWQLVAQVNDHLIVNIIAVAPAAEFDTAGLAKIIETFRPHA